MRQGKDRGMIAAAQNVMFSIGGHTILDRVSVEIEEGSFFALFGPDDAGKTTLLNLLCGFCGPDDGNIELCGQDPYVDLIDVGTLRYVPTDVIMEDFLTGRDYLRFCKENIPYYKEEIEQDLCELFQLSLDQRLTSMTYNENKMIQIVGAISAMPKLLVLDEPGNYLDKNTYRKLLICLELFCKRGVTILAAVESYAEVQSFCTHYAYIKEGKIVASAKVPNPDYRKKMVIMNKKMPSAAGEAAEPQALGVEACIAVRRGRAYYLFSGNSRQLCNLVLRTGCEDAAVEELTLEEELDQDYSRWL